MQSDKISCIMVTRDRPNRVKKAINFFVRQTWPNKELVIVADGRGNDKEWLEPYVESLGQKDIRCYLAPPVEHISALRNAGIEMSTGEVVCMWDDDDRYHSRRLEFQIDDMVSSGAAASYISRHLILLEDTSELFWVEWPSSGLPGSLMCRRSLGLRYSEDRDPILGERGKDTSLAVEVEASHKVALLKDRGYVYTYVWHGKNMWDRMHCYGMGKWWGLERSFVESRRVELGKIIAEYIAPPVAVTCLDGSKVSIPLR